MREVRLRWFGTEEECSICQEKDAEDVSASQEKRKAKSEGLLVR